MKRFSPVAVFAKLSVALPLLLAAPAIQAQEQIPDRAPAAEQPPISDIQLKSFAKAYIEFEKIRTQYEPKLNAAGTPQEQKLVQEEAVAKFDKALQKEGLSMQQYSAIFHTVNANETLREKVLRFIEEERAAS